MQEVQEKKKTFFDDVKILKDDFRKHLIYTIFVSIISITITYSLVSGLVNAKIAAIPLPKSVQQQPMFALSNPANDSYTERGSPYDNRTVGSESANVIFHGARDKKKIALTFDAEMTDGMRAAVLSGQVPSSYDKRIPTILTQTHTEATLFLTGMWIELYPSVTKELAANPLFELGSHSYSDTSYAGFCYGLSQLPNTIKIEDIGATEKLLHQYTGKENRLFRFPGGCYTPADVKLVNEAHDSVIQWDVVGADGFNSNTNQIVHNITDNAQNGSIIVLHMNGTPNAPKTAEALPSIIANLKAKGFEFVKVSELIQLPL